MNEITNLVAIASLLLVLALGGGATQKQAQVNSPAMTEKQSPSRIALNHNETMISDSASLVDEPSLWSQWLTSVQQFFSTRPTPNGCDSWGCGTNHNETMVSDTSQTKVSNTQSQLLTNLQLFLFTKPLPGACTYANCGGNHNETLLADTSPTVAASTWSQWLSGMHLFFFTKPVPGGCDSWGCGMNHNETMVRDGAR